jgi:hypothetical protein
MIIIKDFKHFFLWYNILNEKPLYACVLTNIIQSGTQHIINVILLNMFTHVCVSVPAKLKWKIKYYERVKK